MKPSKRQDTYRHQGLRNQLIRSIQKKGISDPAILAAMEKVPRHFFFDSSFLEYAYEDQPFPIGAGQTISQPYTVAFQTLLLKIKKGEKVLEIGTGSGYQACILAELGAKVFSIERQKTLYDRTRNLLAEMGYQRIKLFYGDGYKGLPSFAPFDKVLVTAAAPYIPDPLINQLKPGGILVMPVGEDIQIMTTIHKISETEIRKEEHGHFRFVPMLEDRAKDH
ncbi:MAG: protein-L-isoaspartate(D-aspartate) O-methyltransferase [Bacteroidetes bacterium]|nr:protein-L-isoaspartate(D-aspartate) O-methyltransferase [Bacteroidota bacterium]